MPSQMPLAVFNSEPEPTPVPVPAPVPVAPGQFNPYADGGTAELIVDWSGADVPDISVWMEGQPEVLVINNIDKY